MMKDSPFGPRTTADQVLAGVDLSGKHFVITGCDSGIGFETMNSLAANGAHVIGLAKTFASAAAACEKIHLSCTPLACDLADLSSVAAAVKTIIEQHPRLNGIIANAGVANLASLQTRYGVEMQFLVNYLGHFALINGLCDRPLDGAGRIVMVSSNASVSRAPPSGIMFDNLDGARHYDPMTFYAQSKLALAIYAKELSRRLSRRGIAVNSLHPGATRNTGLNRHLGWPLRAVLSIAKLFMKTVQQGAATSSLLAASPRAAGVTGEYWRDCRISIGSPWLFDSNLAARLWKFSEERVTAYGLQPAKSLEAAA